MPTVRVRFEQAVYGSFPFWDRGYALLAHSPGCRPEWLAEFLAACQRYGEPRGGAPEARGLFSPAAEERPLDRRRRQPPGARRPGTPRGPGVPRPLPLAARLPQGGSRPVRPLRGLAGRLDGRDPDLALGSLAGRGPRHAGHSATIPAPSGSRRPWRAAGAWPSRRPGRSTRSRGRSGSRSPIGPGGGPRSRPGPSATATGSTWSPCPAWRASSSTLPTSTRLPTLSPRERVAEGRVRVPASARATALAETSDLAPPLVRETHPIRPRGRGDPGRHPARPRPAADDRDDTRPVAGRPDDRGRAPRPFDRRRSPDHPRRASPRGRGACGTWPSDSGSSPPTPPPATSTRPR